MQNPISCCASMIRTLFRSYLIIGNAGHFFDEDSESHVWRLAVISRLSARPEVEALIAHWNEVDAKRSSERAHSGPLCDLAC